VNSPQACDPGRHAKCGMTSETKSSRVSSSFRSPLICNSTPASWYCPIRSIASDTMLGFVPALGPAVGAGIDRRSDDARYRRGPVGALLSGASERCLRKRCRRTGAGGRTLDGGGWCGDGSGAGPGWLAGRSLRLAKHFPRQPAARFSRYLADFTLSRPTRAAPAPAEPGPRRPNPCCPRTSRVCRSHHRRRDRWAGTSPSFYTALS
jgi:hypothetical protein